MKFLENQETDNNLPALASCYEHIGDVLLALNDYSLCMFNYLRSLKARERYYYDGHPEN